MYCLSIKCGFSNSRAAIYFILYISRGCLNLCFFFIPLFLHTAKQIENLCKFSFTQFSAKSSTFFCLIGRNAVRAHIVTFRIIFVQLLKRIKKKRRMSINLWYNPIFGLKSYFALQIQLSFVFCHIRSYNYNTNMACLSVPKNHDREFSM